MKKEAVQGGEEAGGGAAGRKIGNRRVGKNVKKVDDDETPLRQRAREFVEGRYVTMIMSFTTIFALFGDDFRLWFTTKDSDPYFYGGLCLSFLLFSLEILVNSCVVNDFKFSFFWWLDIIATLSLIPDIDWIVELFQVLVDSSPSS